MLREGDRDRVPRFVNIFVLVVFCRFKILELYVPVGFPRENMGFIPVGLMREKFIFGSMDPDMGVSIRVGVPVQPVPE